MSETVLVERVVEILECLKKLQKELDLFNLVVAEERVKTGLNPGMVDLYKRMGALAELLSNLEIDAGVCSRQVDDLITQWERGSSHQSK